MEIELVKPFPVVALPRVWRWVEAHRNRIADDYFVQTLDEFVDDWELLARRGRLSWGVKRDGILGGVITAQKTGGISYDLHCVFDKDFWGHKTTVPALEQVCELLFAPAPEGFGAEKIATRAFSDNMSLSGLVRALGGSKEGIQRGQTRRGGVLVDVVLLGLQKERYRELRSKSSIVEPGHQPGREQSLQSGRDGVGRNQPGPDARAAGSAVADHAADPRPGDEPRAVPGAVAESGAQPSQR